MGSVISSWAASESVTGELLLDVTGLENAKVAYSFARKLRADYAGAAYRVKRSSDSTQTDIGFSNNEVDTDALLAFVGAGTGYVKTIYDQSGNGIDVFDGNSDTLTVCDAGAFFFYSGRPFCHVAVNGGATGAVSGALNMVNATLHIVKEPGSTSVTGLRASGLDFNGWRIQNEKVWMLNSNDNEQLNNYVNNPNNVGAHPFMIGLFQQWTGQEENCRLRVNGVPSTAPNEYLGDPTLTGVARYVLFANTDMNYPESIAEFVTWGTDIGDTNAAKVETNTNAFYNLF